MNLSSKLLPVSFFLALAMTPTLAPAHASPAHSPAVATSTSSSAIDKTSGTTAVSSSATSTSSDANNGTNENSKDSASDAYPRDNKFFHTMKEIDSMSEEELRKRPLLYWRRWANKPPQVGLLCTFFFLVILTLTEFFKTEFAVARDCSRRNFWRCFGLGLCLSTLMLAFARMLLIDMIGAPLGYLLVAVLELLALAGLAVGSTLLAEAVLRRARLAEKLSSRPALYRVSLSLLGTILVGFVLAIPGVGAFPPIGVRLVSLISLLGAGALLKTRFGRRPL